MPALALFHFMTVPIHKRPDKGGDALLYRTPIHALRWLAT